MRKLIAAFLSFQLAAAAPARAIEDAAFEPGRRDTRQHMVLSFLGSYLGTKVFEARQYPAWRASLYGPFLMSLVGVTKEYAADAAPSGNDLIADAIGVGAGSGLHLGLSWKFGGGGPPALPMLVTGTGRVRASPRYDEKTLIDRAADAAVRDAVRWAIFDRSARAFGGNFGVYQESLIRNAYDFVDSYKIVGERKEERFVEVDVQTAVKKKELRAAVLNKGLRAQGEHLEFQFLVSSIRGGHASVDDPGTGETIQNETFASPLMGLGVRGYFTGRFFAEGTAMMMPGAVKVGTRTDAVGTRTDLFAAKMSPVSMTLGYRWFEYGDIGISSQWGLALTLMRFEERTTAGAAAALPRNIVHGGMIWSTEVQWIPLNWLGAGLRLDYRSLNRYEFYTEKKVDRWFFVGQFSLGF